MQESCDDFSSATEAERIPVRSSRGLVRLSRRRFSSAGWFGNKKAVPIPEHTGEKFFRREIPLHLGYERGFFFRVQLAEGLDHGAKIGLRAVRGKRFDVWTPRHERRM